MGKCCKIMIRVHDRLNTMATFMRECLKFTLSAGLVTTRIIKAIHIRFPPPNFSHWPSLLKSSIPFSSYHHGPADAIVLSLNAWCCVCIPFFKLSPWSSWHNCPKSQCLMLCVVYGDTMVFSYPVHWILMTLRSRGEHGSKLKELLWSHEARNIGSETLIRPNIPRLTYSYYCSGTFYNSSSVD
jgi:hypothetical protein